MRVFIFLVAAIFAIGCGEAYEPDEGGCEEAESSLTEQEVLPRACVEIDIFTEEFWFSRSTVCTPVGTIGLFDIQTNIPPGTNEATAFITVYAESPGNCSLYIDDLKVSEGCEWDGQMILGNDAELPVRLMFIRENGASHPKRKSGSSPPERLDTKSWHKNVR